MFDDADERTLRRTQLCLKGDKHFMESEVKKLSFIRMFIVLILPTPTPIKIRNDRYYVLDLFVHLPKNFNHAFDLYEKQRSYLGMHIPGFKHFQMKSMLTIVSQESVSPDDLFRGMCQNTCS